MDTMGVLAAENSKLRAENEELHEQVYYWKSQITTGFEPPREWGLTPMQITVLRCLIARPLSTHDMLYTALYGYETDRNPKIVNVTISHLRRKLRPYGATITSVWGRGWSLDEASRARYKS